MQFIRSSKAILEKEQLNQRKARELWSYFHSSLYTWWLFSTVFFSRNYSQVLDDGLGRTGVFGKQLNPFWEQKKKLLKQSLVVGNPHHCHHHPWKCDLKLQKSLLEHVTTESRILRKVSHTFVSFLMSTLTFFLSHNIALYGHRARWVVLKQ